MSALIIGLIGWKLMAMAESRDRSILPDKLSAERVDLRLALGHERCQMRAIPLEEGVWVRRLATPVASAFRLELRNQGRHPPRNLPIDQIELALDVPACLLHPVKECLCLRRRDHAALPDPQPMKFDAPL
jgi:hypothetical protein